MFAQPAITSFSPMSANVGENITIYGSGFSTNPSNNLIFFGTTKAATPISSTANEIVVKVPSSAKDDVISVLNTSSGKQGKSRIAFVSSNSTIANTTALFPFNQSQVFSSVTISTGNGWGDPTNDNNLEVGDLDWDGKPDIIKGGTNGIGIYRNTSSVGTLTSSSFTSALTLSPTNTGVRNIAVCDIDNDGKLDVLSVGTSVVSIFRNTTTAVGSITFATKVDVAVTGFQLRVADMNNDGMLDMIIGGGYNTGSTIRIYKNTTASNVIAFDPAFQLTTPAYGRRLDIGDMNNDGLVDIISYTNSGSQFYINSSTSQNFSFSNSILLSTGVYSPLVFDLNRDGLNDITGDNYTLLSTSASVSSSSFNATTNSSNESFAFIEAGDLTGDGYPEIMRVSSSSDYSFSAYRINNTTSANTFGSPLNFPNTYNMGGSDGAKPKIIDFDGDGKKDIIFATGATGASAAIDQSTFLIYRNTIGEPVDFYPDAVSYSGMYLNYLHKTNYWKTAAGVSSSQSFSFSDCILNVNATGGNNSQNSSDAPWSVSSTFKFYNSFYLNIGYYPLYHSGPYTNNSSAAYIKFTSTGTYGRPVQDSPNLFPIGRSTYNPITITNNTGSIDDYKILVNDAVYKIGTSGTLALNSIQREWIVTKTNANTAGTGTTLKFDWSNSTSAVNGTVTTPALFIYNTTTTKWEKYTTGVTTSGNTLTLTNYTGVLNGTKFAIGDNTTGFPYETITVTGSLTAFQRCSPAVSASQSFTVSGTNLTAPISIAALTGFQYSTDNSNFSNTLSLSQSSSNLTVYVRMKNDAAATVGGNIVLSSTGATPVNIAVTGTSVSASPVVTTTSNYTCGPGTVALSASATNTPTSYAYYSDLSGGSLLSSSSTYTTPSLSSNNTYYVEASNTCGTTSPRVAVTASVLSSPSITTQPATSAQTVCQNTPATALTIVASGAGLSYQWYSNSTASNSGGTLISGATNASYTPLSAALGTTYYYCIATGTCAPTTATSSVSGAINVVTSIAGSVAVTGGNAVCTGNTKSLTVSGHTGSIVWQSSSNGSTWNTISGETATSYTTSSLTANTHYRAQITNGSCAAVNTSSQLITVDPLSVAGTISGAQAVCPGATSTLSLAGHTGTIVWTTSATETGTYNSVGSAASSYTTAAINGPTYYKAQVTSGVCPQQLTSAYAITTTPLGTIGNISGPSSVTLGGTATFSVPSVTNVTSYVWNLPSGLSIPANATVVNNGATITVDVANNFVAGIVSVYAAGCTNSASVTKNVNPIGTPSGVSISTTFVGAPLICGGESNVPFSVTAAAGATYAWTLPAGISFVSGYDGDEQPIEVDFSQNYVGGSISCTRTTSTATNTVNYAVSGITTPGAISGPTELCGLSTTQSYTYSISEVPNATSYEWLLPTGMTGTSTTATINVNISGNSSGSVRVRAINACGTSAWRTLGVVSISSPSSISGPSVVCGAATYTISSAAINQTAQTTFTYSVTNVSGNTYTWTVPSGMTLQSGQGTHSITVSVNPSSFTSGQLSVVATSQANANCISSPRTLSVSKATAAITGPTAICGITNATYSVPSGSGSAYTWFVPSWMTITSGLGTNSITVDIDASGTSTQTLSVQITTTCGVITSSRSLGCGLFTQLSAASCGSTIAAMNTGISANQINIATGYKFEVKVPSVNNNTYYVESPDKWFSLNELTSLPLVYATDYAVRVSLFIDGAWGGYGASCTVTTPTTPVGSLSSASCNSTLSSVSTGISATNVPSAAMYKFQISIPAQSTSVFYYAESPDTWISLAEASGMPILYGTTYSIKVAIQNGDGTWGAYGTACTVTTPSLPTTTLATTSCGVVLNTIGQSIAANNVANVAAYRFQIAIPTQSPTTYYYVESPDRWFTLSEATSMPQLYGTTYSISVAVKNGTGVWGPYASACNVTTPTLPITTLSSTSCTSILNALNDGISANNVAAATTYRFMITPEGSTTSFIVDSPDRWFALTEASSMPLNYETNYNITVTIENGTGIWGDEGAPCTVTTPVMPLTSLSANSCNTTINSLSAGISANNIASATMYKFKIWKTSVVPAVEHIVESPDRWISLTEATTLMVEYGTTYSISVATKDASNVWTNFGAVCSVTTFALPTSELSSAMCNATLGSINSGISANLVPSATMYRFTITPVGGSSYVVESADRWTSLQEAIGMQVLYSTTYNIAVQVQSNSGDWSNPGSTCSVTTPNLNLASSSCNVNLASTATAISATQTEFAIGYKFRISIPGINPNYYYYAESVDQTISLSEANGLPVNYGTTYSVSVAPQYVIGAWMSYGSSCTVTTPTLPTTTLSAASCGANLSSISAGISANNVASAAAYQFKIWIPSISATTFYYVESPDRWIALSEATNMPMLYATTYSIQVAVQNGTGDWSDYGTTCTVTTPAIPSTMLSANTSCGVTLTTMSTGISANNVAFSTMYEFHIVDDATGLEYLVQSPDRWITLSEGQGIAPNTSALVPTWDNVYWIKVRVQNGSTWATSYGDLCYVNTGNQGLAQQDPQLHEEQTEGIQTEEVSNATETIASITETTSTATWTASATSNPFAHSFQIKLNGAEGISTDATFTAQLTDMSGKVYSQATLNKEQLEAESFGEQLAPGMYLMTLRQGEELRVIRVVKR